MIFDPDHRDPAARRKRREEWRAEHLPVGRRVRVHDGTRATVPAVVIDNTGVMIKVRLEDGRELYHYEHDVCSPEEDS
jgi:hypothetical protein